MNNQIKKDYPIDAVILWVDGSDEAHFNKMLPFVDDKQLAKTKDFDEMSKRVLGSTWRKLDNEVKDNIDETAAIQLMLDNPSIIKRPILESGKLLLIGFDEDQYKRLIA